MHRRGVLPIGRLVPWLPYPPWFDLHRIYHRFIRCHYGRGGGPPIRPVDGGSSVSEFSVPEGLDRPIFSLKLRPPALINSDQSVIRGFLKISSATQAPPNAAKIIDADSQLRGAIAQTPNTNHHGGYPKNRYRPEEKKIAIDPAKF